MKTIDELAIEWSIAKQKEEAARDERVAIEQDILALNPAREEGSETFSTPNGVKITTTGKLTYKADLNKLLEITQAWPSDAKPIKTEVKVDETKLKVIRSESPTIWAQIAAAITVTPAKTGIKISFKE